MRITRIFCVIAAFCIFPLSLSAQEGEVAPEVISTREEARITRISFAGLKRTRESYMQTVLQKYLGIPARELDLGSVEVTLRDQGLFSEIAAVCEADGSGECTLRITVKEKISFLPIPFAMYSSGTGFMGGLAVIDTNAFGVRDTYLFGGAFSKSMQTAITMFSKPSLSLKKPGFNASALFVHSGSELHDGNDSLVLDYRTIGGKASVSLTDKLSEHMSAAIGARYAYTNVSLEEDYAAYASVFKTHHAFSATAEWSARFPEANEWFLSEKSIRLSGDLTFFSTGGNSQSMNAQFTFQQPLPAARLRILAKGAGHISRGEPFSMWESQAAVGTTIMPSDFASQKMLGIHLGVEFGIVKAKIATFSIYGLYEQFFGEDFDGSGILNFGYSAGVKMYLSKIAFPALSAGVSHNLSQRRLKFSAVFGIEF